MSPRQRFVRLVTVAVGLSLVVTAAPGRSTATAAAHHPTSIHCPGVALAPALGKDPDLNPDGTPVAIRSDQRGKFVPVVLVHGWTGRSTHTEDRNGAFSHRIDLAVNQLVKTRPDRSLVGQLQRVPGAAVFTFDYHDYSGRWVDDPLVGPALGEAVDCLFRATGEKVIIVAHSMGGLATRYALGAKGSAGIDRASAVSTVVTLGTPGIGSLVALLGNTALTVGAGVARPLTVLRLILAVCGRVSSTKLETGTPCALLPAWLRAADSAAGRAMRYGSTQLAALASFPKGVTVHALAGDTVFTVPKAGWFHLPWEVDRVSVGDLIVMVDSATHDTTRQKTVTCDYQLNAVRGAADLVGLTVGLTARNNVARPFISVLGPCYHVNLMRTIELTNEVTGIVNEELRAREQAADPHLIRFDGIGELDLRLTAADLTTRGYLNQGNMYEGDDAACVRYAKEGQRLSFSVESATGRVLAITNYGGIDALHTQIGDIRVGSTLAQVRTAFASHPIDEYFDQDFGQGSNGVVVNGPSGSISFSLSDASKSDYAAGRATVTYLNGVGLPGNAPTNTEDGC